MKRMNRPGLFTKKFCWEQGFTTPRLRRAGVGKKATEEYLMYSAYGLFPTTQLTVKFCRELVTQIWAANYFVYVEKFQCFTLYYTPSRE